MDNKEKKAFTLVELLIAVIILGILSVIAFVSLQGYQSTARDSVRIANVTSLTKSLELFLASTGKYPEPTGGVNITYSGSEVWTQGVIGDSVITNLVDFSEKPIDPLTNTEYTYSVLNTNTEFEIATVLESGVNSAVVNQSYAGNTLARAYVTGTYNGLFAKVSSGSTTYILSVPTIINGDTDLVDIIDILDSKRLVFNGYGNLPGNYISTTFKTDGGFDFGPSNILIYEGDINELNTDGVLVSSLAQKLKDVYVGTELANMGIYQTVTSLDLTDELAINYTIGHLINKNLGGDVEILTSISQFCEGSACDFISTWDVGIDTGLSGFNTLKLPLQSGGTYNFTVDWGDSSGTNTITSYNQAQATHNYASSGTYDVVISGTIDGFAFNTGNPWVDNMDDGDKLIDVKQWGNLKISDGGEQFSHCGNLASFSATDIPQLGDITDMHDMFAFASVFNGDISGWDVSNTTNMDGMFSASVFNGDISGWDVSNVTSMNYMFFLASVFNGDISGWDVSQVVDMEAMFYNAYIFNGDISLWDVSSLTNMSDTFRNAMVFNGDISGWDVSNVTNMNNAFRDASVFNAAISGWNVSNVTEMTQMFKNASVFNGDISGWNVVNVTQMFEIFAYASTFNQNLGTWNVSNVIQYGNFDNGASSWILPKPSF